MVTYLLDTNVVSEWRHDPMDQNVRAWVASVFESELAISVITLAELRSGMSRLPAGRRRAELERWLEHDVRTRFRGRILGIDEDVADRCGVLLGANHLSIHIRRIMDFWLAAIAIQHGLTIVSRNERNFRDLGVRLLNPWGKDPS